MAPVMLDYSSDPHPPRYSRRGITSCVCAAVALVAYAAMFALWWLEGRGRLGGGYSHDVEIVVFLCVYAAVGCPIMGVAFAYAANWSKKARTLSRIGGWLNALAFFIIIGSCIGGQWTH